MSFIDYIFIPILMIIIAGYFIVPQKLRWIVLLIASIAFFCSWGIEMLLFVIGATLVAWIVANVIEKRKSKYILWIGVALILGVLVYTKSHRYLIEIPALEMLPILVPLGISYYTMSLISYMADVYWRKDTAEKNFFKLLLFTLYFPKILQGPISKYRNVKESLFAGEKFEYNRFCYGLQRMLWGYFKKLVVADRLALFVTPVFEGYQQCGGIILLLAAVMGAVQLYCDFSGCMDIALGMSEIFGIKLEENFKRPFLAKSAAEFWNRWHCTLGTWFTDYIYMPIVISPKIIKISGKIKKTFGKRPAKSFVTIVPVATVWLITGLWHGTGLNYILWGAYWGTLMIISNVFAPEIKKLAKALHIDTEDQRFQVFRQCRTFFLFVISRILTIPSSVETSSQIFGKILLDASPLELVNGTLFSYGLDGANFMIAIIASILVFYVMYRQEKGVVLRDEIAKLPTVWRWIVYYAAIFSILIFGIYGPGYDASAFVYMNF